MNSSERKRPRLDKSAWDATGTLHVAFSGGADSTCLVHRLVDAGLGPRLQLLHVDHRLDPESPDRAVRAGRLATSLRVPFKCIVLDPEALETGAGLEAAARKARYAALADQLEPGETVLTAHHADDRVETLLLQLMRGAGARGLAGMPTRRRLEHGWLGRPLLRWTHDELCAELEAAGIEWIHDVTNDSPGPDRNYIRHAVLPSFEKRWPGYRSAVLRSLDWLSLAADALDAQAERDHERLRAPGDETTLDLPGWLALAPARAFEVLRAWIAPTTPPSAERLHEFRSQCETAAEDRAPCLDGGPVRIHAWRSRLWLDPSAGATEEQWQCVLEPGHEHVLPDELGTMCWIPKSPGDAAPRITVGPIRPGDRLAEHPGGPHRRATELLREAGVPPWRRIRVPAVHAGERLVALGTRWIDPDWSAGNTLAWSGAPAELLPYVAGRQPRDDHR